MNDQGNALGGNDLLSVGSFECAADESLLSEEVLNSLLTDNVPVPAAAKASDVGEIEETLKWGQPAYLPKSPRVGTTVRLGWSEDDPTQVAVYVHCQTRLLDQFRARFPDEFAYDGNRALRLPVSGPFPEAALQQIAAMALTYHRNKD